MVTLVDILPNSYCRTGGRTGFSMRSLRMSLDLFYNSINIGIVHRLIELLHEFNSNSNDCNQLLWFEQVFRSLFTLKRWQWATLFSVWKLSCGMKWIGNPSKVLNAIMMCAASFVPVKFHWLNLFISWERSTANLKCHNFSWRYFIFNPRLKQLNFLILVIFAQYVSFCCDHCIQNWKRNKLQKSSFFEINIFQTNVSHWPMYYLQKLQKRSQWPDFWTGLWRYVLVSSGRNAIFIFKRFIRYS